jgi:hypothetical protein
MCSSVVVVLGREVLGMAKANGKGNNCVIEVNVPSGPEGWQEVVSKRMKEELDKLKSVVEELGGRICVRY